MFDPMNAGDPILGLIPWVIGIALMLVGFWWIHRIVKDIEDN
jgi:hypothetical protein